MQVASGPRAYELMVKSLLKTQLDEAGLGAAKAFHLKKYLGRSGQEHEIDVSFEIDVGGMDLLFLVECKEHRRSVGGDDVMTFVYRLRDIGAHKGVFVTTAGFQSGAMKVAKAEGIALLTATEGRRVRQWLGATAETEVLWTCGFTLRVEPGMRDVQLIGFRHIVRNETWEVVPLGADPGPDTFLYFLLPEELPDHALANESWTPPLPPEDGVQELVIV